MAKTTAQTNKALVLEAFNTLFNKRDYKSAERYWSANYLQHSAHIKPGRDGLFDLIRSSPATLRYEPGTIIAEGDYVIVHGRFTNTGRPKNWIAADIVRVADGLLAEHWDVFAGRSNRGRVAKRLADVRDQVSQLRSRRCDPVKGRRGRSSSPMTSWTRTGTMCAISLWKSAGRG